MPSAAVFCRAIELTSQLHHVTPAEAAHVAATVQQVQPALLHMAVIMLLVHSNCTAMPCRRM
jgi:hypothetical protein